MKGRWRFILLLVVLALGVAVALSPRRRRRAYAPPNIVLVVLDTLRADALGCYGSPFALTPNLDRIAAQGLRFERAVSQAPWTVPSMASLLTGLYPSEHGIGAQRSAASRRSVSTLPERLAAHGYQTAAFSEIDWHVLERVFQTVETPVGTPDDRLARPERDGAALTFTRALEWLRARRPRPFLLLVHTFEIHDYFIAKPYQRDIARRLNPSYRARFLEWAIRDNRPLVGERLVEDLLGAGADDLSFVRGLYLGGVAAADRAVGRLADALDELGLADDTVLVVVSDHGEGFAPELKRVSHGGRLHEDLLRVPLLVRWPARVPAGVVTHRTQVIDVLPTLTRLAGIRGGPAVSGESLLVAEGGWRRRLGGERFVPAEASDPEALAEESSLFVDETGRRQPSAVRQYALYAGKLKLIQRGESSELYDLEHDSRELRDLAPRHPDLVRGLRDRLARMALDLGGPAGAPDAQTDELLRSLGYVR